jgi:AraC family ethanolamine operon transcriptional activator
MLRIEKQLSYNFEELTNIQYGWDFSVSQLSPSEEISRVNLFQTPHIGYNSFYYSPAYDQRLRAREGMLSFGLLDPDNPLTWAYDQLIPNDSLTVFPHEEDMKAASPAGFRGSGIHISEDFMTKLAERVYDRPMSVLLPTAGLYATDPEKLGVLRKELSKWQQLETYGANLRPAIISRREESLALSVLDVLVDESDIKSADSIKSGGFLARSLDLIHGSELENISAAELCKQAGCSQRTLEKCFKTRFGVTPKKYIKCLRLAHVHKGLRNFDAQGFESIIELAGINGFWHMGQFAADYRRIYGELPSETLSRK